MLRRDTYELEVWWLFESCCFFYLKGVESIVIVLSFSKLISWAFLKGTFYGRNQKLLMFSFLLFPVPLCHFLFPADLFNFILLSSIFFAGFKPSRLFILPFFSCLKRMSRGRRAEAHTPACLCAPFEWRK